MKIYVLFVSLFFSTLFFSQVKLTDVLIVKQDNDSLHTKMNIGMIVKDGITYIDEVSLYKRVDVVDDNGKKLYTIKAKDIKELSFLALNDVKKKYLKDPSKNQLMEVLYDGKIKLYKQFVPTTHYMGTYMFFVQPNGEPFKVGLFENNIKILTRITASKPKLKVKIDALEKNYTDEAIVQILKEFEQ